MDARPRRHRRALARPLACAVTLALAALPRAAAASPAAVDELSAPRLPTPFALPEISHADADGELAFTLGSGVPRDASHRDVPLALVRASFEAPVGPKRRLYVGAALPIAGGLPPSGSGESAPVLGNVEAHARVVFPMPSWLAFGVVLGAVAPTARFDRNGPAASAAYAAASTDPTNALELVPGALALRPAFDLRLLRGPLVVQLRDGVDVVFDTGGARGVKTRARLLAHAGVLASPSVEIAADASQAYLFDAELPDAERSAITLGPSVRVSLGAIDVGLGGVTNVGSPLAHALGRFYAGRLSLVVHLP